MGSGISSGNTLRALLTVEAGKPLDTSDLVDVDEVLQEVKRLRRLIRQQQVRQAVPGEAF